MTKRSMAIFFIITILFILLFGIYRVYEIFYSSYFSPTEYTQTAFIGEDENPTKMEILLYGFQDLKVVVISSVVSILIICYTKLIRRRK